MLLCRKWKSGMKMSNLKIRNLLTSSRRFAGIGYSVVENASVWLACVGFDWIFLSKYVLCIVRVNECECGCGWVPVASSCPQESTILLAFGSVVLCCLFHAPCVFLDSPVSRAAVTHKLKRRWQELECFGVWYRDTLVTKIMHHDKESVTVSDER